MHSSRAIFNQVDPRHFHVVHRCRVCGSTDLQSVVDLGVQSLTGVFPRTADAQLTRGPLEVVRCTGDCGLVQLHHRYDPGELYGGDYGYRSALNRSMVEHLHETVQALLARVPVGAGDVVLDIPKKKFEHIFDGVKKRAKVKKAKAKSAKKASKKSGK